MNFFPQSAARSGGVYFLRARASFTEGLAEEPHHPGHVTTVISAVSISLVLAMISTNTDTHYCSAHCTIQDFLTGSQSVEMGKVTQCAMFSIIITFGDTGNIIGLTVTTPVHTMGLDCLFDVSVVLRNSCSNVVEYILLVYLATSF